MGLLRPERFDWLTQFGRRHFHAGRGGRAKLALTSNLASRVVLTLASLMVMPITVRYLGNEGYGLMVVMTNVVGWLQFSNLGIGAALQNPLTQAYSERNVAEQQELLSTAIASLAGISLVLLIGGAVAFFSVNWVSVFPPATSRFVHEIPLALLVVFLGFVSSLMWSFVGPLYAARQELHLASVPSLAAGLLNFAGTLLAVQLDLGLVGVVLASVGCTSVVHTLFALWTLYLRGFPELVPRWSNCSVRAWRALSERGWNFSLMQVCTIAFFQADAFIIAHFLTASDVTPYSVAQKGFAVVAGLFAVVTGSLWSAYGDAKAARDVDWIRRTQRTMRWLFLAGYGGLAVAMVLVGHRALGWWVGEAAAPGPLLIAAVACYFCAREWTSLHAGILNGLDVIGPQIWVLAVSAILILALNVLAVRAFGAVGLAMAGFIGFSALSVWYLPLLVTRALRQVETDVPRGRLPVGVFSV
jgi:O-antigen/teichoic acid export membrane protein